MQHQVEKAASRERALRVLQKEAVTTLTPNSPAGSDTAVRHYFNVHSLALLHCLLYVYKLISKLAQNTAHLWARNK